MPVFGLPLVCHRQRHPIAIVPFDVSPPASPSSRARPSSCTARAATIASFTEVAAGAEVAQPRSSWAVGSLSRLSAHPRSVAAPCQLHHPRCIYPRHLPPIRSLALGEATAEASTSELRAACRRRCDHPLHQVLASASAAPAPTKVSGAPAMKRRLSETLRKLDKEKGRQKMFALACFKSEVQNAQHTETKTAQTPKASQPKIRT